jgi:hypothetical protein
MLENYEISGVFIQVVCLILVVIVCIILAHSYYKITFLTAKQVSEFFELDPDGYFSQLTIYDIRARGSNTVENLVQKSIEATQNFSLYEKFRLLLATRQADIFFKRIHSTVPYVNGIEIANIPWKLAKTKWNSYEGGYPHTRQDIIFITDKTLKSPNLVKTLVHEKVHVWERMYPEQMKKWILYHKWKPYASRFQYPMARSNPDLDDTVYIDPRGKLALVQYTSKSPKNIVDAKYPIKDNPVSEHPNETLAYYMDYLYSHI